jgi:hypothetical protein
MPKCEQPRARAVFWAWKTVGPIRASAVFSFLGASFDHSTRSTTTSPLPHPLAAPPPHLHPPANNQPSSHPLQRSPVQSTHKKTPPLLSPCAKSYVPAQAHALFSRVSPEFIAPRQGSTTTFVRVFANRCFLCSTGPSSDRPMRKSIFSAFGCVPANSSRVTKSVLPSGSFTRPQHDSKRWAFRLTARFHRQTISGEHGLDGSGV